MLNLNYVPIPRTYYVQNLSPCRTLLESMLDETWNLFEHTKSTPYSLVNLDGSRYYVFAGLDSP